MKSNTNLIAVALLLSMLPASANQTPNVEPWPGKFLAKISSEIGEEWEDAGTKLSTSIFESITDRELFSTKFSDFELGLEVKRRVYDNHDILDTWTVIDFMKIPAYLPIPIENSDLGISNGNFGVQFGLNLSLNAFNIRQVAPKAYQSLKTEQEIQKAIEEAKKVQEEIEQEEEGADLPAVISKEENTSENDEKGINKIINFVKWESENPKTRARYSKLLNLITHPLRIPLTEKKIRKMPVGEISSYSLDGTVQLAASVGFTGIDLAGIEVNGNVGLGVTTYVSGRHRVSILKENENTAHVKLTKERNHGLTGTLGSGEYQPELFEGFVVLDHNLLRIAPKIIPFTLSLNKNYKNQFDVGYKYDLNNPKAMKAYTKAVLGRFKLSEDLINEENSGVTKSFTRVLDSETNTRRQKLSLSLLFEKVHSTSHEQTTATITMDGEVHHLFKSVSTNLKAYDTIWGSAELKKYSFETTIDKEDFEAGTEGITLKIEGSIEDSNTNGKELYQYMSEVEQATGIKGLFERAPVYEPEVENKVKKRADYDKTSFFYRLGLTRAQIEKFMKTPEDKMWKILEVSFAIEEGRWTKRTGRFWHAIKNSLFTLGNAPLSLFDVNIENGGNLIVAKKFFKRWKKLKKIENPEELTEKLAKLFTTINHSHSLVRVVREALQGEKISYFITAKADKLFGRFSKFGGQIDDPDTISYEANKRIEFDRFGARTVVDPKANILKFDIEVIDNDTIEVSFDLPETPEFVYIRVDRTPGWGGYKNLLKLVLGKSEIFKKGTNKHIVKRVEENPLMQSLSKALFNGKQTTVLLSISLQNKQWGAVSSESFKSPKVKEDDKDEESEEE